MSIAHTNIKPFEWLTSSKSILPLIESLDFQEKRTALHVGCGSSTLGEALVAEADFQLVVNIDKDHETLERMKERWSNKLDGKSKTMEFRCVDWCVDEEDDDCNLDHTQFNLVLDKSTLDCTLCSDRSTAGLIKLVHDHLSIDGYYLIISFHDVKLLLPMLQDCPGTKWNVSHQVITREVEDLIISKNYIPQRSPAPFHNETDETVSLSKTVNVLICQKYETGSKLSLDAVQRHVHETNDTWFQSINPLLSPDRQQQLQQAFSGKKDLQDCYRDLFTDLERESLTYDFFLEDWEAYCKSRQHISKTSMTLETALDFLCEMQ